jgi:hypothetical protein
MATLFCIRPFNTNNLHIIKMAKTISIDDIRRRKKLPSKKPSAFDDGGPFASPSSYIILLDENDQPPTHPPVKERSTHRHTKN